MCEQVILDMALIKGEESTTMQEAATEVVAGFIQNGKDFTAYDVTKALRAEFPFDGEKNYIAHKDVRQVVAYLYYMGSTGVMGNWDRAIDPTTQGALRYSPPAVVDVEADEAALLAEDKAEDTAPEVEEEKEENDDESALLAVD